MSCVDFPQIWETKDKVRQIPKGEYNIAISRQFGTLVMFYRGAQIKSPRLRLWLFIAVKCVKSQNHPPFYTMKAFDQKVSWRIVWWAAYQFSCENSAALTYCNLTVLHCAT